MPAESILWQGNTKFVSKRVLSGAAQVKIYQESSNGCGAFFHLQESESRFRAINDKAFERITKEIKYGRYKER
jgi:hypothetical protein